MAKLTAAEILAAKYMVRVAFKHNGKRFKTFDEVTPKDEEWTFREVIELVRTGRIMPFDPEDAKNEVFFDVTYLLRRSPMGNATAEVRDVIQTGHLDEATDGVYEMDIPAFEGLFSTRAMDRFNKFDSADSYEVVTSKLNVIAEDRHALGLEYEAEKTATSKFVVQDTSGGYSVDTPKTDSMGTEEESKSDSGSTPISGDGEPDDDV